jgi:hypothetical protein
LAHILQGAADRLRAIVADRCDQPTSCTLSARGGDVPGRSV